MTDYISRDEAMNASKIVYMEYIELDDEGYEEGNADDVPVVFKKDIEAIPAADVVPRSLYEQACAVRDIAVEQLRQIGKDVGDSMDDVMVEPRR